MIKKIKNNKVLSNISWIVVGKIIHMGLNFIVGIITARYLGPSDYGLIGYAASYTTFFAAICSLGINSIIIKEFIDNTKNEGIILGTSIGLKLISSTMSFIIIVGFSSIVDINEPLTKTVVFIYCISIIFQTFDTIKYWFQSKLQSKYIEIAVTIGYIFISIYKIFLLTNNMSVEWFAVANSVEYIFVAIILYSLYRKKSGTKLKFSWEYGKKILKNSYHFIISGMMVALYNSTDKFMLKQILNESEVSYYTIAITISSLCTFLLSAIIDSLNPMIMEVHKLEKKTFEKKCKQLYAIIFYMSISVSIFIAIFANIIIKILYGDDYILSVNPLRILTWYTAFSYLGVARDSWIVCENKQKYLKYIYISCALCNIVLNYFFIPTLGATGAAISSLITQIGTIAIFPLFIRELRPNVKLMFESILLKGIK